MRRQRTSFTLYKRNKQLQNSLWLRICCSQICFMHKRLNNNNSTKFHFGNINNKNKTTTLKTITTRKTINNLKYIKERNVRNLWTAAKASIGLGLILPANQRLELEQLEQVQQQHGSTTTILP